MATDPGNRDGQGRVTDSPLPLEEEMSQFGGRLAWVVLIILVAVPACRRDEGGERPEPDRRQAETVASAGAGDVFRGYAVHGHEVRSFRLCGTKDTLWAVDRSQLLWDLHVQLKLGRQPYEEVFAVVRGQLGPPPKEGFGADYPGQLIVEEVLYATREGFDCDTDWEGFRYRAMGNEPFWSVEVSPTEIRLRRPGFPDVVWVDTREKTAGDQVQYMGDDDAGRSMELTITRSPCRDTMSGAYFGLSATLRIGSEELKGCALIGSAPDGP
jgi:uncharacterized membrane protein